MPLTQFSSNSKIPFQLVKKELTEVERQISAQVQAFDPTIEPYIEYICNTSGKRIRPILAILAGGAISGEVTDANIKIGVILELIHMSTLVHDDIIDGAVTRRKVPTANAKWSNGMAVLLGDALFSHSLLLATEFDDIEICRKVGRASREVCQGEVMQTQRRFDPALSKKDYFRIIEMKTGVLFAAATGISAHLSGADADTEELLYNYGMKLGTAYQIYDDCLDLVGAEEQVGKTLRTDLEKGKLTLPLLLLLEKLPPVQLKKIKLLISNNESLDLPEFIESSEYEVSIQESVQVAADMLSEARQNLQVLQSSTWRDGLEQITFYLDSLLDKCRK